MVKLQNILLPVLLAQVSVSQEWVGIINGDPVQTPLPVIVSINMNDTKLEFIGSGVVISKDWVITVGHLFLNFDQR